MHPTNANRPSAHAVAVTTEALESRRLMAATVALTSGVLNIAGTAAVDDVFIAFRQVTGNVDVAQRINGSYQTTHSFPRASVKSIKASLGDGGDGIFVDGSVGAIPATIDGGAGSDNLTGGKGNDTIVGGLGNDRLNGAEGKDRLDAGAGDDNLSGGAGDDTLLGGDGRDNLSGGSENDTLDGGLGPDRIGGELGNDTVTYATRTVPITVDITEQSGEPADDGAAGEGDFVTVTVENVIGGSAADRLTGTVFVGSTPPTGFSKNNRLVGNGGNDVLTGLDGNDTINGGLGTDQIIGGAGNDTVDYSGRSEALTIKLDGLANDGAAGENDAVKSDVENATGGNGADTIIGNALANILSGGGGADTIRGGAGNDRLSGGGGLDKLFGEDGDDTFFVRSTPTADADSIDGGAGSDKAQVDSADTRVSIETLLA